MAGSLITIFCYWGGSIVEGQNSLSYEGGQRKGIRVSRDTTYAQLLEKTYRVTNFDKEKFNMKMACRYPNIIRPNEEEYIRMDVSDNEDVIIMLDVVNTHPQLTCVHLYLVLEPNHNSISPKHPARKTSGLSSQSPLCRITKQIFQDYTPQFDALLTNAMHENEDCESLNASVDLNAVETLVNMDSYIFPSPEVELDNDLVNYLDVDTGDEPKSGEDQEDLNITEVSGSQQSVLRTGTWDPSQELRKDLIFEDKAEFMNAMKTHHIMQKREYTVLASTTWYCVLICKLHSQTECKWRVRASTKRRSHGKFRICVYEGPHNCLIPGLFFNHKQLDYQYIAREIKDMVKAQPAIKISVLRDYIIQKYNYAVSKRKLELAKQKAISDVFGDRERAGLRTRKKKVQVPSTEQNELIIIDEQPFEASSPYTNMDSANEASDSPQHSVLAICRWDPSQELSKDLIFENKAEFINAIKAYHALKDLEYFVQDSCARYCVFICKLHSQTGCKWRIRASKRKKNGGKFQIGVYKGPHTCVNPEVNHNHQELDPSFLARVIKDLVKEQPTIKIPTMRSHIIEKYGHTVSYKKLWCSKQKAMAEVCIDSVKGCGTT